MDASFPALDQFSDQTAEGTSSSDFLLALKNFLGQNNIDRIGRFRIRVEPTANSNWTLVVMGEAKKPDWDGSAQIGLDVSWPSIPTPPEDISALETIGSGANVACGSSGVSPSRSDVHVDINTCLGNGLTPDRNLDDLLAAFDFDPPLLDGFPPSPSCGVSSWPSITGDEASSLASPLVDHVDPMTMDSQSPLSRTLSLGPVEHEFAANYSPLASSPVQDRQSPAHRRTSTSSREARAQAKLSKRSTRPHRRRRDSTVSNDATELIVKTLSQNVLCEDYYSLLKSELPRWARDGLWQETPQRQLVGFSCASSSYSSPSSSSSSATTVSSSYLKLERAYLAVCQLDTRMSDDVVRNRIALIQLHLEYTQTHEAMRRRNSSSSSGGKTASTVGRGDASHVIDRILENTHGEWDALDQRRRAELRAKFHDRKKYGKRWSQLADALGPGILLVCATRLAFALLILLLTFHRRSTTVTAKMLEDTIERIKVLDPDTMKIIGIVSPLAESLLKNDRFDHSEVVEVLRQLE